MSSLRVVSDIFIKNYMRKINKKVLIINAVLLSLPIFILLYIVRDYNIGFKLISSIYIGILLVIYLKNIVTSLFIFDEYEFFLGFPTNIKEIFISKFLIQNINIGINSFALVLAYFFEGILKKYSIWYYLIVIIGYFIVNFLFILVSCFFIMLYYRIKYFIITGKWNVKFRELIENIDRKNKTYKNKGYKKNSKLRTLAIMDVKKVLRNKVLFKTWILNIIIMLGFSVVMSSFVSHKFPGVVMYALIIMLIQVNVVSSVIPNVAFSKVGIDQEFILMFPVSKEEYIKSRIISSYICTIPIIIVFSFILFGVIKMGIIYKILTLLHMLLASLVSVILGMNFDGHNIRFDWLTGDDLYYNSFASFFKQLSLTTILFAPFYVAPLYIKWLTFEVVFVIFTIILVSIFIYNYKKVMSLKL
ncbi:hypothetical protein [Clostridium mediterraneense]|uniref:hypothetical protein n=1 Tax=Clostridium mediterraneense TaxID=1805472 RepID=UPI000829EA18|nr:hypothetical protein [Clostridium mediterraneense]